MNYLIPLAFILLLQSCGHPLPSGNMTVIESHLINSVDKTPIPNQKIYIVVNTPSFIGGGGNPYYDPADSVLTDENGYFEYAFFHANNPRYYLTLVDGYCSDLIEVPGGTFFRKTIEATPFLPLLNVNLKATTDSIKDFQIEIRASHPCIDEAPWNYIRGDHISLGVDTLIILDVLPFDTVSVFVATTTYSGLRKNETQEAIIKDQPVQLFFD